MPDFHTSWQNTPIFIRACELYKSFYIYLPQLPRKDRYALGQKCEMAILELVETIVLASNLSKTEKLPILKKASMKVDLLRVYFTLGKDLKIIDQKKHTEFELKLTEIGKMVGGWIKTTSPGKDVLY